MERSQAFIGQGSNEVVGQWVWPNPPCHSLVLMCLEYSWWERGRAGNGGTNWLPGNNNANLPILKKR